MDYFKYTSFYVELLVNGSNYKMSFYHHYIQIIYSIKNSFFMSQDESM